MKTPSQFPPDEQPTLPDSIEHRFARMAADWRELTVRQQKATARMIAYLRRQNELRKKKS